MKGPYDDYYCHYMNGPYYDYCHYMKGPYYDYYCHYMKGPYYDYYCHYMKGPYFLLMKSPYMNYFLFYKKKDNICRIPMMQEIRSCLQILLFGQQLFGS